MVPPTHDQTKKIILNLSPSRTSQPIYQEHHIMAAAAAVSTAAASGARGKVVVASVISGIEPALKKQSLPPSVDVEYGALATSVLCCCVIEFWLHALISTARNALVQCRTAMLLCARCQPPRCVWVIRSCSASRMCWHVAKISSGFNLRGPVWYVAL